MNEKTRLDKEQVEILIVEDSPTQALQLKYLLEQNQFIVSVAENGQQALDLLCKEHPSVVISDIIMPLMNGYELCKRLKDNQETQNIPVILLTSLSNSEDVLEGLSCGADNFITKPYKEEYLVAAINQIISTARLRKNERVRVGVEIMFGGKRRFITADQQQMLTLLISSYEAAVHKNNELIHTQEELRALNERLESLVEERTANLKDRVNELKCLYAISSLVAEPFGSIEEALKTAVDLIPSGWQYPEITRARITFEGEDFTTPGFKESKWKQSADIVFAGGVVGSVEIFYLEEKPELDEGPFQKEERDLITDIARQLGVMIQRDRGIQRLSASEIRYRRLFESAKDGILILDPETGIVVDVNPFLAELLGFSHEQLLGKQIWDLGFLKDILANKANFLELQQQKYVRYENLPLETADGRQIEVEFAINIYQVNSHNVIQCNIRDITESKRSAEELKVSLAKYKVLFETLPLGITISDNNGKIVESNNEAEKLLGLSEEETLKRNIDGEQWRIVRTDGTPMPADEYASTRALKERRVAENVEMGIVKGEGDITWINVTAAPIPLEDFGVAIVYSDITERKQVDQVMRKSEKQLSNAVEIAHLGPWEYDTGSDLFTFNDHFYKIFRTTVEQEGGYTMSSAEYVRRFVHPDDAAVVGQEIQKAIETDDVNFNRQIEHRILFGDGTVGHIVARFFIIRNEHGRTIGTYGTNQDITERKMAEEALRESEIKFRCMFENMAAACCLDEVIYKDGKAVDYRLLDVNPAFEKITGINRSQAVGALASQLYGEPEIAFLDVYAKVAETGESVSFESYFPTLEKHLQVTSSCPAKGQFSNVFTDITEAKRADEEKAKLEEQLNQSQKMESIGRLAGGVAHDFNNLLTAITGFSDLIFDSLGENDPLRDDIAEIQKAADSAAALTKQLLAFSRKQLVSPKIVNLNKSVAHSEKMLRRIIGEDIDFVFVQDEDLGKVRIDPGQVDQILINLAVNSRDAMPGVGKLMIEIKNLTLDEKSCQTCLKPIQGEYVMIAVSDTGTGIDKTILASIFEPFFTTKEKGKGTGLGLSTIHGIVHQNEGHVNVYSELGVGTTFKIYLPRVYDEADVIREPVDAVKLTGSETVLLVEDMQIVRNLASRTLRAQGYRVIEAEHGGEALIKCEEAKGEIDLLLTDVIMPQMSGKQLYSRLLKTKPDLKALFMSGYTANAIAHHGVLDQGTNFIQKPFRPQELAAKVREVIDAPLPVEINISKSPLDGKTVLVIDDEKNLRTLFSEFLRMSGCKSILARNAAEGIKLFKENRDELSAVILDETLPDSLGHLVLQDIRAIDAKIPVILTSGYSSNEIVEVIKNIEAVGFLQKPFVRKDLLTALEKALSGNE